MHENLFDIFISFVAILLPLIIFNSRKQAEKKANKKNKKSSVGKKSEKKGFKYMPISSQYDNLGETVEEFSYYSYEELLHSNDEANYFDVEEKVNSTEYDRVALSETLEQKKISTEVVGIQNISKRTKAHSLRRAIILSEILGKPKSMK